MKLTPAIRRADREWAVAVKERDNYTCQRCLRYFPEGRRQGLDAHHLFSRGKWPTRHAIENGISLCTGHHIGFAHREPAEFHEWLIERMGLEAYTELRRRSNQTKVSA